MKSSNHNTTKEEIIRKSAKLFAQRGFFGVSMQDIADKLGITKAALYYHFPSKESLYQSVLNQTFTDLWKNLRTSFEEGVTPWDKLFAVIENYLLFSLQRPEVNLFFKEEFPKDDKETAKIIKEVRIKLLNFFTGIIKMESKGRKIASKQVVFLATLILTIVDKSINIAILPPRIITGQILNLILPKPKRNHKIIKSGTLLKLHGFQPVESLGQKASILP